MSGSKGSEQRGQADASRRVLSTEEMAIYRAAAEQQHAQEEKELVLALADGLMWTLLLGESPFGTPSEP